MKIRKKLKNISKLDNRIIIKKISYENLTHKIINHVEIKRNLITFNKNVPYYGVFYNSKLIGCCSYIEFKNSIKLKSGFILPEYRKKGVYSFLHRKRMADLIHKKKLIYANVTKHALNIHLKCGAKILQAYKAGSYKIIYEN